MTAMGKASSARTSGNRARHFLLTRISGKMVAPCASGRVARRLFSELTTGAPIVGVSTKSGILSAAVESWRHCRVQVRHLPYSHELVLHLWTQEDSRDSIPDWHPILYDVSSQATIRRCGASRDNRQHLAAWRSSCSKAYVLAPASTDARSRRRRRLPNRTTPSSKGPQDI